MYFFLLLLLSCVHSLNAMGRNSDVYVEVDDADSDDGWYGPGFYYGIWFDDEDGYWQWRNRHPNYPPSHRYYNHDHPVPYAHQGGDGHGDGHGEGPGEGHGDGGGHSGGGHSGGGGRR